MKAGEGEVAATRWLRGGGARAEVPHAVLTIERTREGGGQWEAVGSDGKDKFSLRLKVGETGRLANDDDDDDEDDAFIQALPTGVSVVEVGGARAIQVIPPDAFVPSSNSNLRYYHSVGSIKLERPLTVGSQWWLSVILTIPASPRSQQPGCLLAGADDNDMHVMMSAHTGKGGRVELLFGTKSRGQKFIVSRDSKPDFLCCERARCVRLDVVCIFRRQVFILNETSFAITPIGGFCPAELLHIGNSSTRTAPFCLPFADLRLSLAVPPVEHLLSGPKAQDRLLRAMSDGGFPYHEERYGGGG